MKKLYFQGLAFGVAFIATAFIVGYLVRLAWSADYVEVSALLASVVVMLYAGYLYKKHHGPLIFSSDGLAVNRLLCFSLGIGTFTGPFVFFANGGASGNISLAASLVVLVISVPFSGFSFVGGLLLGSFFYKERV